MPELYGKPSKDELRAEIRELGTDLWKERKEHKLTRDRLKYAYLKNDELEATRKRMEQKVQELLIEATQDVESKVKEKFIQSLSRKAG